MKKIYSDVDVREFWKKYWEEIGTDEEIIGDYSYYPFTALKKYLDKDKLILEAGCGTGRVLKGFHNQNYRIVGFDYDLGCVSRIGASGGYKVFCSDILEMPLKTSCVDAILCFGAVTCMERKEDVQRSISEIKRVLKKDGLLVISLLNYNFLRRLQRYMGMAKSAIKGKRFFHGWADSLKNLERIFSVDYTIVERLPSISRQPIYDYVPFFRKKEKIDRRKARVDDREYRLNRLGEFIFGFFSVRFPYVISGSATFICRKKV